MNELVQKYDEFLYSLCPWEHYMCNLCNFWSTHPLNYCCKCPGRIIRTKVTWLKHIKLSKEKYYIISLSENYAGINLEYPSEEYDMLYSHLKEKLSANE